MVKDMKFSQLFSSFIRSFVRVALLLHVLLLLLGTGLRIRVKMGQLQKSEYWFGNGGTGCLGPICGLVHPLRASAFQLLFPLTFPM